MDRKQLPFSATTTWFYLLASMESSLPLDLPLPNLPMVKEESETDASNSLIKEEKAVSLFFYTV